MIRFRNRVVLEVIENYDEYTEVIESTEEVFEQGEQVDADVFAQQDDTVDIQFADGSVALSVTKDDIEEI